MVIFKVQIQVGDPQGQTFTDVEALVDTGASITAVPGSILDALGVQRSEKRSFGSALGDEVVLDVGDTVVIVDGQRVATPVVFNLEGTEPLLGAMTLERAFLGVDTHRRRLMNVRGFLG
jgi:clan AA aspartic protease